MKKFCIILLTVSLVLGGLVLYLANYLLEFAVNPPMDRRHDIQGCYEEVYKAYPEMKTWNDSLVAKHNWRDTTLVDDHGLRHHAIILQHDSISEGTTIMLHGHNDNAVRMMRYAFLHYEILGRDVIVPDHFGHGESQGDHIRFGWLDRKDVTDLWIPTAHQLWPAQEMIVHGLSMGGALTMFTSGETIPDEMKLIGYIEDCGFNSIWEQLAYQLDLEYGLPAFPLLELADFFCKLKYGWSLKDGEASPQLAKCTKPMLFIHGDSDLYVPLSMLTLNYEAKTQGYKELWVTEGCDHAESIHKNWEEYCTRCKDFINRIETMK